MHKMINYNLKVIKFISQKKSVLETKQAISIFRYITNQTIY